MASHAGIGVSGGGVTAMRMSFPLLRNDGAEEARVRVRGNTLHAHLRDGRGAIHRG